MSEINLGGPQDLFYSKSNFVPLPLIVKTEGIWMEDDQGNRYIDVSSGPVVSNIGHGNEKVARAMYDQAVTMDFAYSRVSRHQPNIDLTRKIAELAGGGYQRVALASGGSEAMEIALKFLRQYVVAKGQLQKRKIITLSPSYHGGTIATLAITGDDALDPFIDGFAMKSERIPAPFQYRVPEGHSRESYRMECADALEAKIQELGADNVLAFVIEPIGGLATGAQMLSEDYANRVREICDRHGIYLVYDEILCGAGRSGKFLASSHWPKAKGDLVVLAKGLAAGYAPLGAVLMPGDMVDELAGLTGFNFSHTYNANPITCATGVAVLEVLEEQGLVAKAGLRGDYLRGKLELLAEKHACIGDIRGKGLLMAVELVADRKTKQGYPASFPPTEHIRIIGLQHGLIIYSRRTANGKHGDWFMVAPPLTITEAECDDLIERLDAVLGDFETAAVAHMGSQ
ncbi:Adenosylmethionine-8-amino-7-oxononanoate aminotransferase [Microbulbifer donghaiensis]|uniref:Adenosylmethionine-8-amino-7-oxononanoate aminotransferase n=1 Tax=Microbulbifer donghaiensis TaxID=494016 RepID=A0A1M4UJT0_9GAMM|nr:aminotransferase class III-fold pyridoxal phosphate-dependent enzyme [Microbulbifer donghaiensis]SHE56820.1 Adenosylmethionine-8-amino-7-oxononanoate aminotransferase [Microbulbifer donghaiensis]